MNLGVKQLGHDLRRRRILHSTAGEHPLIYLADGLEVVACHRNRVWPFARAEAGSEDTPQEARASPASPGHSRGRASACPGAFLPETAGLRFARGCERLRERPTHYCSGRRPFIRASKHQTLTLPRRKQPSEVVRTAMSVVVLSDSVGPGTQYARSAAEEAVEASRYAPSVSSRWPPNRAYGILA